MTPQQETIAFQIWAYCEPLKWDVTIPDIAASLDLTNQRVSGICRSKGWLRRLSLAPRDNYMFGDIGCCAIDRIDDHIK